ncbi:MAG: diguanylate cyclase [Oscillochloridaceae bacterium umkhey_bin13]
MQLTCALSLLAVSSTMLSPETPNGRGDILVVDDTPANLRLLTQVLQGAGYRVRTVTTGARALSVVRQQLPALLLLDVRLPDIDGVTLCSQLKADPLTSAIPVIFISALDEAEAKVSAFSAGGVDYVTKPIHPDEVLARVSTHLALRELHLRLQTVNQDLAVQLSELAQANQRLEAQVIARRIAEQANTRLLEDERRRTMRLDSLRAAMTAITGALDLPSVHQAVANRAVALLGATWGALAEALPPGEELRLAALHGLPVGLLGLRVPWGTALIGKAAASRRIINSETAPEPLVRSGVALAAPLVAGDQLEGVIVVVNPQTSPRFNPEEVQLLDLFAQQAAIAIQNARLFEEVRHLARTDPLTGLYNRRSFYEAAQRELERARRLGSTLAVILLDIDHFKLVNDEHGHQAGDRALEAVADLLRASLRTADISARYGGEELVVLLPDTSPEAALAVAERLRRGMHLLTLQSERGPIHLTASFGVATCEADTDQLELESLLARADEACYAAKHTGRDRVIRWSEPTALPYE